MNSDSSMVLYFAYGSNLNQDRLEARVGKVQNLGVGPLKKHVFDYSAGNFAGPNTEGFKLRKSFFANVRVPKDWQERQNGRVWGAIYALTQDQLHELDQYEGYGRKQGYTRVERYVHISKRFSLGSPMAGQEVRTWVYMARPDYIWPDAKQYPTAEYMWHILKGAAENNFPRKYVNDVIIGASSTPSFVNNK